jgi:hypothetical protein
MKTSLLSLLATGLLFVATAASAAPAFDHDKDPRRLSPIERARYEAAQRQQEQRRVALERARYEANQRRLEQDRARLAAQREAAERARWEAQHRNDRGHSYGYNRH